MTATTSVPVDRKAFPAGLVLGSVSGAALFVAGVWKALFDERVTVSGPPASPRSRRCGAGMSGMRPGSASSGASRLSPSSGSLAWSWNSPLVRC
jgi:hypothetical protein